MRRRQTPTPINIRIRIATLCSGLVTVFAMGGCHSRHAELKSRQHVQTEDVTFYSKSLERTVHYLVFLPANSALRAPYPTVYLLHGAGADYLDWATSAHIDPLVSDGYVLVMPDGNNSYDVNAALVARDRYEDFLTQDLLHDVEIRFPVSHEAGRRALVGVSMGGFGALTIAMRYPKLFGFVAAMSSPLDAPRRTFDLKRFSQSMRLRRIFGPLGSESRRRSDPFIMLQSTAPHTLPYLFLSCGTDEPLLAVNRRFAQQLAFLQDANEFHTPPGGHSWSQWNAELPQLTQSLQQHVR